MVNIDYIINMNKSLFNIDYNHNNINKILSNFPNEINNYHHINIDNGNILYGILNYINNDIIKVKNNIYVYDTNKYLINVYKDIQYNFTELYNELYYITKNYNNCYSIIEKERFYYNIRSYYNNLSEKNKLNINGSALYILINNLCFRKLYRKSNEEPYNFNVPFGYYNFILSYSYLLNIHNLIKNVNFIYYPYNITSDFMDIDDNDFIYFNLLFVLDNNKSLIGYQNKENDFIKYDSLLKIIKSLNNKFILHYNNIEADDIDNKIDLDNYEIIFYKSKRGSLYRKPKKIAVETIIKNYI